MDRILVTGGTGFVGFHLLKQLCKMRTKIIATYISDLKLKKIKTIINDAFQSDKKYFDKIAWKKINILDCYSLEKSIENIDYLYHCAALVSFDTKIKKKIMQVNTVGTANVVNSALNQKIKKMIYVSSIATLDKKIKIPYESDITYYAYSKYQAELEVWRGIEEGLNAVIVNPGVILGSVYFKNPISYFFNLITKNVGFYPTGGTGFVMIEDVVKALILLKENDTEEKQFCVVAENISFQKIIQDIAKNLNKKKPKIRLTEGRLKIISFFEWVFSVFFLSQRSLNKGFIRLLTNSIPYDGYQICKTLKFSYSSIEEGIENIRKKYIRENFK